MRPPVAGQRRSFLSGKSFSPPPEQGEELLSLDKEIGPGGGAETYLSPDRLVQRWQDVVHAADQVPQSHADGLRARGSAA